MRSAAVTYLLTYLLLPGTAPAEHHQNKHIVLAGSTAVLGCRLDGSGEVQDLSVHWFKQLPRAAPIYLLSHFNDSSIHRSDASSGRYQPIRNGSHAHLLKVTNATVEDSAVYFCMLTRNGSFPVWGGGVQLSVYGGKGVWAPAVALFSSPADDSGLLYAVCVATGFYPSVIEVTWKSDGEPFQEDIQSGPFLEGDKAYSVVSIVEFTSQSPRNLSSVVCEVRHDSSRTFIRKELHRCHRNF